MVEETDLYFILFLIVLAVALVVLTVGDKKGRK